MARTTVIAIRRAGSTSWTRLGPSTTDNVTKMGWLLKKQQQAREATDYALSLPRRIWDWAWEFFNLDTATVWIRTAGTWLKRQAVAFGRFAGALGGMGLGLLAVTTETGRSILKNTVGRVLGWFGAALSWAWDTTRSLVSKLGAPGRWVSARMYNLESAAKRTAVSVLTWYSKNIAPHLDLNSLTMRTGRAIGVWAVVIRALHFITPLPLRIGLLAATAMWTLVETPLREAPGFDKAAAWLVGEEPKKAELKAVDAEYHSAVKAAAEATASTGKASPTPANRQAQRAAQRGKATQDSTPRR
jgi:hypothetical protein